MGIKFLNIMRSPILLFILIPIIGVSQIADCDQQLLLEDYLKAQQFKETEKDSFEIYTLKFITGESDTCENVHLNYLIDSWKLESIITLAEIETNKTNFIKSNDYLNLINDPFTISTKNLYIPKKQLAKLYANNYSKLDSNLLAIEYILPHTMSQFKVGTDAKLVEFCVELLLKEFDQKFLLDEYKKSIKHFYKNGSKYFIQFLGIEIPLGSHIPLGSIDPSESIVPYLKSQMLFELLDN